MKFSDDRISHLSLLIRTQLAKDDSVEYVDEEKAFREIRRALIEFFKIEEIADVAAREKISHLKRNVPEGSREWDILYRQYLEEELAKRGRF